MIAPDPNVMSFLDREQMKAILILARGWLNAASISSTLHQPATTSEKVLCIHHCWQSSKVYIQALQQTTELCALPDQSASRLRVCTGSCKRQHPIHLPFLVALHVQTWACGQNMTCAMLASSSCSVQALEALHIL